MVSHFDTGMTFKKIMADVSFWKETQTVSGAVLALPGTIVYCTCTWGQLSMILNQMHAASCAWLFSFFSFLNTDRKVWFNNTVMLAVFHSCHMTVAWSYGAGFMQSPCT